MRNADGLHGRVVATLRLLLPLVALGVLSTLFLFSRDIDPARALLFASVDADDLARDPRIGAPRLSSVTDDGTALTLVADTVRVVSGTGERITGDTVRAEFEAPDGGRSTVVADKAVLDREAGTLRLTGAVRLTDDRGHVVDSAEFVAALDRTWLESPGPVTGTGPLGQLEAGAMVVRAAPAAEGDGPAGHDLLFTGGVRLVHLPASPHQQGPRQEGPQQEGPEEEHDP